MSKDNKKVKEKINLGWKFKALLQAVLSIFPFGESLNYQLQKANGSYSKEQISMNASIRVCKLLDNRLGGLRNKSILEVGTGWQPVYPFLFYFLGAKEIYTFDHVRHARLELIKDVILKIEEFFPIIRDEFNISIDELKTKRDNLVLDHGLDQLFNSANIKYIAPGDASNTGFADNSVDLFFSFAVLEHIPEKLVEEITSEAFRTLKIGGLYYNRIGLQDHFVSYDKNISPINFLKYPESIWRLLAGNDITYLNRLRNSQYVDIFKRCGLEISMVNSKVDEICCELAKTMKLAKEFRNLAPEDLATLNTEIIAKKPLIL